MTVLQVGLDKELRTRTLNTVQEILDEKNIFKAGLVLFGLKGVGKSLITAIIASFQEPNQLMIDTLTSHGSTTSTKLITAHCKDEYCINVFDLPGDINTKKEIYIKSIGDMFYKNKIPLEMLDENAATQVRYNTNHHHTIDGANIAALVMTYEMLMNPQQMGYYTEISKELSTQMIPHVIIVNKYNVDLNGTTKSTGALIPFNDQEDRKNSIDDLVFKYFGNRNIFYIPNVIRTNPFEINRPLPIEALDLLIRDDLMIMLARNAKYIKVESMVESLMPKRLDMKVFEKKSLDFIYKNQFISLLIVIILSLIIFIIQ